MKQYKSNAETYSIVKNKTNIPKVKITSARDAYEYIKNNLYSDDIEVFESMWLLLLNQKNIVTGFVKISQGGIAGTVVDVKIVGKYVLGNLAPAFIIAHNHPSGEKSPSNADITVTNKIKDMAKLIDSRLLDHLIITKEDGYYSFAEEGLI